LGSSRTVAKNTAFLTVGLMSGRLLSVFVFRKMAGALGAEGVGVANLAIDVAAILLIIANYGLGNLITREIARERVMTLPIMWAALQIRIVLALFCYVVLVAYIWMSGFAPLQREALLIMGLGIFLEASAMACDAVLQAHDMAQSQMWGQIASAIAYFGFAIWWLNAGFGVMGVIWANVVSRVVRLIVMVPLMLAKTGPWIWRPEGRQRVPATHWRSLTRMAWPVFLSTTFGILYFKIDTPLLRAFRDSTAVGVYTLGHRGLDVLAMVPQQFAVALFPAMVRAAQVGQADFERISERSLRFLHLIVLPLTLLCTLAATPITMWLAKGEAAFDGSITVFRIMVWSLPFMAATPVLNRMLFAAGRERDFVVIALAPLGVNLALNLLIIPRYGYLGASCVVVVTMAASTLMHWWFVRRAGLRLPITRSLIHATGALAAAWVAASGLAQLLAPSWGTSWTALPIAAGWRPTLVVVAATALMYVPAMWLTRAITGRDLPALASMLRRE
jgi:O-antigen/teichoic acid export membrane protein